MIVVPPGKFTMGSPKNETGRDSHEDQVDVTISRPFAVSKYEVTFDEWDACVDAGACNGYKSDDEGWGRGRRPVINVSWHDATAYAEWLAAKTGKQYRPLTEAEWEYAARAGSRAPFSFGGAESELGQYAWYSANSESKTHPVGQKKPNAFGLYDMHGNVWEWVNDWYGPYESGPQTDPQGPSTGRNRVYRGGSWSIGARGLRSAIRYYGRPVGRRSDLGFRLARTLQ